MESPFASWMDRYALEYPQDCPEQDPLDPLLGVLQEKGYAHESGLIESLRSQGKSLQDIGDTPGNDRYTATIAAMKQGIDVIVQGRLESANLAGFADFLVKVPGKSNFGAYYYEVWDAKLSHKVKPSFLIQLCCYADMLETIQGVCPESISVILGTQERKQFKTLDFVYYYRRLLATFRDAMENFEPSNQPDPSQSRTWGKWSNHANAILAEKDHLFQVANINKTQIKRLTQAGINSMQQLSELTSTTIPGLRSEIVERLQSQALLQKRSTNLNIPEFKVLHHPEGEKTGLALLPPSSSSDVFFDIEGDPFEEGGLEYLWGSAYWGKDSDILFKDFWAHNAEQEMRAFKNFIDWVYNLWKKDPSMHIYHYAHYEISACRKLMGKYGICETEVDQLLRNGVFVDLYKVIREGVLVGETSYSLKDVEHVYGRRHSTLVAAGDDSIVAYENWRELYHSGKETQDWETSPILKSIRDYNIEDCESTLELAGWLRTQQQQNGVEYVGKSEVVEPDPPEIATVITTLRDKLLEESADHNSLELVDTSLPTTLAWSMEYHRRENKPMFWRLFERLGLSPVELLDDFDCLAFCERTSKPGFKPTPKAQNLAFEYRFDANQAFKGAQRRFYLLGIENALGRAVAVTFLREFSDLDNGIVVVQAKNEPPEVISLVPDEYVHPDPIPAAILDVATHYDNDTLGEKSQAIVDFLNRAKPRITNQQAGPIAPGETPSDRLPKIIEAAKNLNNSYITIQGPPGAGKSFTAVRIIADLLRDGKRIGISSNSHRSINHLLLETAKYCNTQGISATYTCTSNTEPELKENGIEICKNEELYSHIASTCVVGTTAWGFARDDMQGEFDYLFIDEAGQVPVANLIAMSRSARNLILIGDQMQLSQPTQGSHPLASGLSILDYLLLGAPTISDDMGIFLGTTYRMHPKVNGLISRHIYEGKLEADKETKTRTIAVPRSSGSLIQKDAGILFIPTIHEGNTQGSDEEAQVIADLTHQLIGREFTPDSDHLLSHTTRPIELRDILFVAPYNHQVNKLRSILGPEARIGSVDRFQGQEAPIVFLSMCASDPSESPRGLNFLLDKNRINVAISRAQTLAIVVGNPNIGITPVTTVEQMNLVNLFNAIMNE
jgi:uncharacterized protein